MRSGEEAASLLVLWLGEHAAPEGALATRGVAVCAVPSGVSAAEIAALAPDLVVLSGASAAREGELLRQLADAQPSAVPPIAVVGKGARTTVGRAGIVARLDASLAPEALAGSIESVLARVHAAAAHSQLVLDATGLDRFVAELAREARAGVLLRATPPGAIALGGDGTRVTSLVPGGDGPSSVRFYERAPGKLLVQGDDGELEAASRLDGIVAIVVDDGVRNWDPVVEALEGAGARVTVADAETEAIEKVRADDPALLIVPAPVLPTRAGVLLCEDPRLASAALLVIDPRPGTELDPARVLGAASRLCAAELAARARIRAGGPLIERIEALGAVRWLKVLADAGAPVRLRLRSALGSGEIRLEGGKIREATYATRGGSAAALKGGAAARALVAMPRGTLLAGPLDAAPHERQLPAAAGVAGETAGVGEANADEDGIDEEVTTVANAGELRELLAKAAPKIEPKIEARVMVPRPSRGIPTKPSAGASTPTAGERDATTPSATTDTVSAPGHDAASEADTGTSAGSTSTVRSAEVGTSDVSTTAVSASAVSASAVSATAPTATAASTSAASTSAISPATTEPVATEPRDVPSSDDRGRTPPTKASVARASTRADERPHEPAVAVSRPAPRTGGRARGALYAVLGAGALVAAAYVAIDHLAVSAGDASAPPAPIASPAAEPTVVEPAVVEPAPSEPVVEPPPPPDVPAPIEVAAPADPPPSEAGGADPSSTETQPTETTPSEAPPAAEAAAPDGPPTAPPAGGASDADADALVAQSDEAMRRREYARGLELAQQALAVAPQHPRAAYDSALALLRLGRDDEAVTWAERAVGWDPSEPLFRLLLGDIHQQNGRRARAHAAWRACVEVEPLFAPCQRRLETAAPP